jgi:hypothetical protein
MVIINKKESLSSTRMSIENNFVPLSQDESLDLEINSDGESECRVEIGN